MDSFFGIGLPELILILVLAGIVMGPHRIRQVARKLGRITAQLQAVSRQFARQLNAELDALDSGDIKGAMSDVRDLQKEIATLRKELESVPRSLAAEKKNVDRAVKETIQSPVPAEANQQPESDDSRDNQDVAQKQPLPKPIDIPDDPE